MAQYPHPHGNDVELLAHHLAEALELHAVVRAGAFVFGQPMLDVDAWQCLGRNEIERLFRRLKEFRRIFSRFEKLDVVFLGFIVFALIVDALR